MRVIEKNKITSISASSSDAAYNPTYLLNEYPTQRWKAASSSVDAATLTIRTNGVCDALGIVGITADSATVSIADPNGVKFETGTAFETGTEWATTSTDLDITTSWIVGDVADDNALWCDFDQFTSIVDIEVTFRTKTGSPETIAAGVVYAGEKQEFRNPEYGLAISGVDYSTVRQLRNGATYTKKRKVARTLSGIAKDGHDDVHGLLKLNRANGPTPLMWSFIDDATSTDYIMYCRFVAPPTGTLDLPRYGTISLDFIEAL